MPKLTASTAIQRDMEWLLGAGTASLLIIFPITPLEHARSAMPESLTASTAKRTIRNLTTLAATTAKVFGTPVQMAKPVKIAAFSNQITASIVQKLRPELQSLESPAMIAPPHTTLTQMEIALPAIIQLTIAGPVSKQAQGASTAPHAILGIGSIPQMPGVTPVLQLAQHVPA